MANKYFFLLYCTLSILWLPTSAQIVLTNQPEQDACHAIPICGNFKCPFAYFGHGSVFDIPYIGNVTYVPEFNSVWLKLTTATPGTLVFSINPGAINCNFDFSVYKNISCNNVNWPTLPYRVNMATCNSPTGLAVDPSLITAPDNIYPWWIDYPFSDSIEANTGDTFLVLIEFPPYGGNANQGFSIDFSGSTATFASEALPHFASVDSTCNKSQEVTVKIDQPIKCNSVAVDGSDFYVTPSFSSVSKAYSFPCTQIDPAEAYPNEVTVQFSSPLPPGNYWLHAKPGTDGNTLINLCGDQQPLQDSIAFTVDPYTPISFTGIDSPACQYLVVGLSRKVLKDSIAANGSDFWVIGPSAVTVAGAIGTNQDIDGLVDTIQIALQEPVQVAGTYQLVIKNGTDFNTLKDSCGAQMIPGTKIPFQVQPFNSVLSTTSDTFLCKADTIMLNAKNISVSDVVCGLADTSAADQFSGIRMVQQTPGIPAPYCYINTNDFWYSYQGSTTFETSYKGRRLQILIRASELQAMGLKPGLITAIGWTENPVVQELYRRSLWLGGNPPASFNPPIIAFNDFSIKIGCTNLNQLTTGWTSPLEVGQQVVCHRSNYHPNHGINDFVLDNPFAWDGFSNLLIETCSFADTLSYVDVFGNVTYPMSLLVNLSETNFNSCKVYTSAASDGCIISNSQSIPQNNMFRPITRITMTSLPSDGGPYQWSPSEEIIGSSSNPAATAFVSATTGFTVSTTDRLGCYLKDTVTAIVSDLKPSVTPEESSICIGDKVQILADAGVDSANFNWIADQPLSLTCLDCNNPIAAPLDSTIYELIVSDRYGCKDTLPVIVNVMPLPSVVASPSDTIIKYGSSIQLQVTGADFYSWAPGRDLDMSTGDSPVATLQEPTDFIVVGLAGYGCRNADTIHIDIDYSNNLILPSVFSPNGDGKNDLFKIINLGFEKVQEFRVFNRWGQEVFAVFDNRGWDGTFNGTPQDMGTYHYLIRVGVANGRSKVYKGDITLIK